MCFSTKLDADSKKWRFFADLLNDCALSLELCAPYAVAAVGGSNGAMTGILCVSGVAKSIVGVAGGATRAALTQHQVLNNTNHQIIVRKREDLFSLYYIG